VASDFDARPALIREVRDLQRLARLFFKPGPSHSPTAANNVHVMQAFVPDLDVDLFETCLQRVLNTVTSLHIAAAGVRPSPITDDSADDDAGDPNAGGDDSFRQCCHRRRINSSNSVTDGGVRGAFNSNHRKQNGPAGTALARRPDRRSPRRGWFLIGGLWKRRRASRSCTKAGGTCGNSTRRRTKRCATTDAETGALLKQRQTVRYKLFTESINTEQAASRASNSKHELVRLMKEHPRLLGDRRR
jgi:hypothetical protein